MTTEEKSKDMMGEPNPSSLRKLTKSINKTLPPLKLDLDDLQELENVLRSHRGSDFEITTKEYSCSQVLDLSAVKEKTTSYIRFKTHRLPTIDIELGRHDASIYSSEDSATNRGIVEQLNDLLLKRKRRWVSLFYKLWWLSLLISISSFTVIPYFHLIDRLPLTEQALVLITSLILWFSFLYSMCVYAFVRTTVIFKYKDEMQGFWARNKDEILVKSIAELVKVVAGILIGIVIGYFIGKR